MEGGQLSQEFGISQAGTLVIFTPEGDFLESIQDPLSALDLMIYLVIIIQAVPYSLGKHTQQN